MSNKDLNDLEVEVQVDQNSQNSAKKSQTEKNLDILTYQIDHLPNQPKIKRHRGSVRVQ